MLAWVANPQVFAQYLHAIASYPPSSWATPILGGILRLLFGPQRFWLQFPPSALGVIWLVVYWARRRESWSWLDQAPLLILVSLVTMAYGWSSDQSSALVAIVQVFFLLSLFPRSMFLGLIVLAYGLINLLKLATRGNDIFLFWLAPVVLLWYLGSQQLIEKQRKFSQQVPDF